MTVYLDGPVRPALGRAVRRESEPWLPWLIGRYAATAEPVTDLESLTGHLQRRRLLTLSVLAKYSWDVVIVEDADSRSTEDTLALVSRHSRKRGLPGRPGKRPPVQFPPKSLTIMTVRTHRMGRFRANRTAQRHDRRGTGVVTRAARRSAVANSGTASKAARRPARRSARSTGFAVSATSRAVVIARPRSQPIEVARS